jgi:hypothetical protein
MNRRELLKVAATTTLALAAGVVLSERRSPRAPGVESTPLGRRLRGTDQGQLLESLDGGVSWHVVAKFGKDCSVREIAERGDQIYLRLEVLGHPFFLRSADARAWHTVDSPPRDI